MEPREIRTPDICLAKAALYQLELRPSPGLQNPVILGYKARFRSLTPMTGFVETRVVKAGGQVAGGPCSTDPFGLVRRHFRRYTTVGSSRQDLITNSFFHVGLGGLETDPFLIREAL